MGLWSGHASNLATQQVDGVNTDFPGDKKKQNEV